MQIWCRHRDQLTVFLALLPCLFAGHTHIPYYCVPRQSVPSRAPSCLGRCYHIASARITFVHTVMSCIPSISNSSSQSPPGRCHLQPASPRLQWAFTSNPGIARFVFLLRPSRSGRSRPFRSCFAQAGQGTEYFMLCTFYRIPGQYYACLQCIDTKRTSLQIRLPCARCAGATLASAMGVCQMPPPSERLQPAFISGLLSKVKEYPSQICPWETYSLALRVATSRQG